MLKASYQPHEQIMIAVTPVSQAHSEYLTHIGRVHNVDPASLS